MTPLDLMPIQSAKFFAVLDLLTAAREALPLITCEQDPPPGYQNTLDLSHPNTRRVASALAKAITDLDAARTRDPDPFSLWFEALGQNQRKKLVSILFGLRSQLGGQGQEGNATNEALYSSFLAAIDLEYHALKQKVI